MLILVTGFEPFGGAPSNASWEAVRRLPGTLAGAGGRESATQGGGGATLVTHLLPVSFERAPRELEEMVRRLRPDAVVCTGVARGRTEVTVETGARNRVHARMADEDGNAPQDEPLELAAPGAPALPARRETTLPVDRLVEAVALQGVPVRASDDAGLFVCNATYHTLLRLAEGDPAHPGALAPAGLFVHVPAELDLETHRVVEALVALLSQLAELLWEGVGREPELRVGGARAVALRPVAAGPVARALRVGVSGGIGSGKSTVAASLAARGALVADADVLARQVVEPGSVGLAEVVGAFGSQVLSPDGSLDRARLAQVVFADAAARQRLEGITHPLIAAAAERILSSAGEGDLAVYDVPLLVENGLEGLFDVVVTVDAPLELRVERLEGRGVSRDEAVARIGAQAGVEERRAVSTIWVDNTGTPEDLRALVDEVVDTWLLPTPHP